MLMNMLGDWMLRPNWRGQDKRDLILANDVAGAISHTGFRSTVGHRLKTQRALIKMRRLLGVTDIKLDVICPFEFYVGNAKQAAHFYQSALGFQPVAYSGPETGVIDRASYAVRQNKITFVLTTPIRANHPLAEHHHTHGDGVKVLAVNVNDATSGS